MRAPVAAVVATLVVGGAVRADPASDRALRDKIVRVERAQVAARNIIACDVKGTHGTCISPVAPRRGDRVAVLDDHGRVAELSLTAVEQRRDTCTIMWDVTYNDEAPGASPTSNLLAGVIGLPVGPAGRRLPERAAFQIPTSYTGGVVEQPIIAIDAEGDGDVDFVLAFFQCGMGAPMSGGDFCLDFWRVHHGHFDRFAQVSGSQLEPCLK